MLSDTAARNAKARSKPYKLTDRDGLYLYVSITGARSWRYDYRISGRRETHTYGQYPEISGKQARELHAHARRQVVSGISPARTKKREKQAARIASGNTLEAVAEDWFRALAPHRSDTWRDNTRRWLEQRIYPAFATSPIASIEASDVLALITTIAAERPKTAEYIRQTLTRIFQHAVRTLRAKHNPARECSGAIMVPPPVHHKPMAFGDVYAFSERVDGYKGRIHTKLAIRLLLLTVVRKDELTGALWSELDLHAGIWRISAARMKASRDHLVPLSTQALTAFEALKPLACGSPFVFPNVGDFHKPMSGTTINRAFDAMGITVVPHGLRATFSTWANESGFESDHIERCLAHVERNRVRGSYNAAEYIDQRRTLLQAWADFCDRPPNVANLEDARRTRGAVRA
jgi:integrase